ncbi:MAG: DUF1624 domain-containing protein [Candidatus Hydrogenedentes bacterium]|nr:DUF1624 domain-containing protein [Candidatus Hydrogenedentota bacterium]
MTTNGRVAFLDLARGLAVFFMIMQHAIIVHAHGTGEDGGIIGGVFLLLGTAPAAPVFMLIMGLFMVKVRGGPAALARRGVLLFVLGYVLNLFRFTLPLTLAGAFGEALPPELEPWHLFWEVDILQLAGLSFLAAAALCPFAASRWVFPVLILVVLFVSPFLWGRFADVPLFVPLWGIHDIVSFPFFPWVIYPLLGMYLSDTLIGLDGSVSRRRILAGVGLGLMVAGLLTYRVFGPGDYYRSGAGVHFGMVGFVLLWLVFCCWISRRLGTKRIPVRVVHFWSRHVTGIYVIQWILFGWSVLALDANAMSDSTAILIGLAVLLLSHTMMMLRPAQELFKRV